jgi:hypothetical protein
MSNLSVIIAKNYLKKKKSAIKRQEMKNMAIQLSSALEPELLQRELKAPFMLEVV